MTCLPCRRQQHTLCTGCACRHRLTVAGCEFAGCDEPAVASDRGWGMCRPHYYDHLAELREKAARECPCGLSFVSTNPARRLCDACRKTKKKAS